LDWTKDIVDSIRVRQILLNACYHGVPNARVIAAVKAAEWLSGAEGPKTAGQMGFRNFGAVVDPQDWWDLEAITPPTIDIRWSILVPKVATCDLYAAPTCGREMGGGVEPKTFPGRHIASLADAILSPTGEIGSSHTPNCGVI